MVLKNISRILLCAIIACAGCKKSETPPPPATPAPMTNSVAANAIATTASPIAPTTLVSRIHWLGKKKIAADTNSASLMAIWNLPESTRLEEQTLDKLSRNLLDGIAAARGDNPQPAIHNPQSTNSQLVAEAPNLPSALATNQLSVSNQVSALRTPHSALIRPLLDDLLNEESYFEIRGQTNQPQEWIFAIRLDTARAALWDTNLSVLRSSLSTNTPQRSSISDLLASMRLTRTGDWTVLASPGKSDLPVDRIALLDDVLARMEKTHSPAVSGSTNWLDADVNRDRLAHIVRSSGIATSLLPRMVLSMNGDGENVFTRGELEFERPPIPNLERWNIPTNFIGQPLASFSAVRGLKPWIESWPGWKALQISDAPNQFFSWGLASEAPMLTYFATPAVNASNCVAQITDLTLKNVNPWFETNNPSFARAEVAEFAKAEKYNGLQWKGVAFMTPFLRSEGYFILGGLFMPTAHGKLPPGLIEELSSQTNLLAYEWELTGPRLNHWLGIGQFIRLVCSRSQLPAESVGLNWLQAVAPRFRTCATEVDMVGPTKFSFVRKSTVGLSALELHILIDWLESPDFPHGLYSTRTPMLVRKPLPHKAPAVVPAPPGM